MEKPQQIKIFLWWPVCILTFQWKVLTSVFHIIAYSTPRISDFLIMQHLLELELIIFLVNKWNRFPENVVDIVNNWLNSMDENVENEQKSFHLRWINWDYRHSVPYSFVYNFLRHEFLPLNLRISIVLSWRKKGYL